MIYSIPSYEELKQIKEEKKFYIYQPLIGGEFRITINEDYGHDIALDYLEDGYLSFINYNFKSDYEFSHLYKFNKKNYEGLIKLYKEMLNVLLKEVKEALEGGN